MSGLGSKHVSKWDSKEDTQHHHHHHHPPSVDVKSGSYYRDKDPEPVRFNAESNASRSSAAAEDQHSGEARTRSRVSQNNDNSYYSEQDETRQQFFHRGGSSRSYSRSRSRSRSPVYRARRDAGSSYDRHKTRTRGSPLPSREFNNKRGGDQSSVYGREDETRKLRETRYHADDFREETMVKGARSSDYDSEFTDDRTRREHLHDGVSDPRLRRHRSELTGEKETLRRDGDGGGGFRRSSNIPCKFFAAGICRNDKHCRFSHHVADRKQPRDNNFYRQDNNNHGGGHNRWNDVERVDNGKFGGMEASRASKGTCETKRNGSSWIDDMEMSPDWNYGAHNFKKRMKEEPGAGIIIGQSSQSRAVVKDNLVTNYDQRSSGMYSYGDNKPMVEKPVADPHQNYTNAVSIAPVQAFDQNHNVLPYQNSLTAGGSQQVIAGAAAAADFSVGLNNPESGKVYQDNHHSMVEKAVPVQSTVTREQIDQISNISATLAQFLANGQPIPQLTQALQMPLHSESSMAVQPNQATQSNSASNNTNSVWGLGMNTGTDGVPPVAASLVSSVNGVALNAKASEENGDKKTDEGSKEEEGKKTGEDNGDAENVVDDDEDDDGSDEEGKKEKDPKGMRAFKFALVEIVKELLKPAWKEGKMNKDGYKNIVKKVVEKVTGSMQSGNVPQTQEKIDHYLSASKSKLTKLVQAYISKVKKT